MLGVYPVLTKPEVKTDYQGQQGAPATQHITPSAQQVPTASTVLDAKNAANKVAIFTNLIFIQASS